MKCQPMTFFMYEMAKNPEIQQKVYDEINDVLERYDGKISYESLSQMKYLECCIDGTNLTYNVTI